MVKTIFFYFIFLVALKLFFEDSQIFTKKVNFLVNDLSMIVL